MPNFNLQGHTWLMIDNDFTHKTANEDPVCAFLAPPRAGGNFYTNDDADTIGSGDFSIIFPSATDLGSRVMRPTGFADLISIDELPGFWFYVDHLYLVRFPYPGYFQCARCSIVGPFILANPPPPPGAFP